MKKTAKISLIAIFAMLATLNCNAASDDEGSLDRNELMQLGIIAQKFGEFELAIKCTKLAADQGSLLAVYNLAGMYEEEDKLKEAADLYMQAANKGDVFSCIHTIYFMHEGLMDYHAEIVTHFIMHISGNPVEFKQYKKTFPNRWSSIEQLFDIENSPEGMQSSCDDHVGIHDEIIEPEEQETDNNE